MNAARPHTDQADDRTRHIWRTVSSSLSHWQGECATCGVKTDNAMLAHIFRDTCPGAKPETAQTFAAKLREIGYQEPVALPAQPVSPEQLIVSATCAVRNCGQAAEVGKTMCRDCSEETEAMERYLRDRDRYLLALADRPTLWSRIRSLLSRIWGGLVLILAVLVTTLGCVAMAHGVEVPDRIVAAIAAVETGTEWRGIGDVRGNWTRGDIGEVGPWQMSPAVLRDLKAYDRRSRVHADPVLAESLVRLWLGRLYERTGCWSRACAAYHAGLSGRHRGYAREYAARVLAIANL